MKLPLRVRERLLVYELVDADGRVVASRRYLPWNGAAEDDRAEVVRGNLDQIVAAVNAVT